MIRLQIVEGSLQISNEGIVILVAPKNSCAIDVLALYDAIPTIVIYNKYLGTSTNIFSQPLDNCEDSTGTPFTIGSFTIFAEGNLGFDIVTPILYSATFFDTTLQTNAGATIANQVLINSTQQASGFTLNANSSVTVLNSGFYFISCNLQLAFTGGASNYNVTVWYEINDVIVPNSAFTFTTTGGQNDQTLASVTDTLEITAGQNIKFYWWSQATGMRLLPTSAGTNPTRPLSPSVNFNIFNVG
jgi:hypothetical protein